MAVVGAEHVLKLLPRGTHEYAIHPAERARAVVPRGRLELQSTGACSTTPSPVERYWLSADTSVNYLLGCQRPQR